jgi:tetratricopeptide (TPR) repeat protein/predicted aspartyl protease
VKLTRYCGSVQYRWVKFATRKLISRCLARGGYATAISLATLLPFASYAACKRSAAELPVTIQGTRPVIDAKFNGQDVKLLFDSGASFSMISSAAVEQYKLATGPAPFGFVMRGVGGSTMPSIAIVKTFTIANVDVRNLGFLVSGNEVGGGGGVGLMGQNFLEKWDVEYDLAKGMIRLLKDEDCRKSFLAYWVKPGEPFTTISIQKTSPTEPLTMGAAYVNGVKIRVIFDTGAALSVLTLKAAERAGVKIDSPGVADGGLFRGIGRNFVKTYVAPFDSFKFEDGEEIKHIRLRVADLNLEEADMLLGSDFFLSHRIFVANSQSKLYFTYNGGPVFNLKTATQPAPDAPVADPTAGASQPSQAGQEGQSGSEDHKAADEHLDAAALVRRGTASAGRRDFEHALADLTRASELEPTNAEYIYLRGQVYLQKGDADKGVADVDRTLELKPDHVHALMTRAELRIRANKPADARADLDAIDKFAAKQADIRYQLGFAYQRINLQPSAITQFDLWIPTHDEDARLANARNGRCRARAILGQDLPLALKDCNFAVSHSLKGSNSEMLDTRALVRLRQGDYDKAVDDYDAALKITPQNAGALYGRGIAKLKKNKTSEGEADIAAAVKISPLVADAYKRVGIFP